MKKVLDSKRKPAPGVFQLLFFSFVDLAKQRKNHNHKVDTVEKKSSREDPRAAAGLVSNLLYFRINKTRQENKRREKSDFSP